MNKLVCFSILIFMLLGPVMQSRAQRRSINMNVGFQLVQPLGEFADEYSGLPAGLAGTLSIPVLRLPIEWGIGYAWNSMGARDKDIIALVSQDTLNGNNYAKGNLAWSSTSSRYMAHTRIRPLNNRIQPYCDLFTGLETFKTTTTITVYNSGYSAELSTNRNHLDMTFFYGWAVGLRVRLAPSIYAEGRYENIYGGSVKYVDNETVEIASDNSIEFSLKESKTNRAVYQVGIAFGF